MSLVVGEGRSRATSSVTVVLSQFGAVCLWVAETNGVVRPTLVSSPGRPWLLTAPVRLHPGGASSPLFNDRRGIGVHLGRVCQQSGASPDVERSGAERPAQLSNCKRSNGVPRRPQSSTVHE